MLINFGKLIYRFRLWFFIFGILCMAGGAVYASGIFNDLVDNGFNVPNSQSQRADIIVNKDFSGNQDSLILLFSSKKLVYTQSAYKQAAERIIAKIASLPIVTGTNSFYAKGGEQFVSNNPHLTYALVGLRGNIDQQANDITQIQPLIKSKTLSVGLGGSAVTDNQLSRYIQKDLAIAEKYSFPIVALLLILIFGSLVAASLPLGLGLYGVIGALVISRLVTIAIPVSVYVLDIVGLLGLGLGIDYSLFIVNRYREELKLHVNNQELALCRTMATAGRTVIFSGLTVMIAVSGLILFPIGYIRSMGIGGAAAVLIAVIGSLLFLPAILALLGPKVNALQVSNIIPKRYRMQESKKGNIWKLIVDKVIKYPLLTIVITLALLLLAGLPFLHVQFTSSNYNVLPKNSSARVVANSLSKNFKYSNLSPINLVIPLKEINNRIYAMAYINKIISLNGVKGLGEIRENSGYLFLEVIPKNNQSSQNENLVKTIRSINVKGIRAMVGGNSADLLDQITLIEHDGIYVGIIVIVSMMILLYMLLGSIVIPLKTIILTALSLSAAFGVLVWIFQDGHLASILGFTKLNGLDASQMVIIFSLAFGLSMDYATFLFSRIRENFSQHADMTQAITWGVQKTGKIITTAAILLLVVIGSFASGEVVSMKEVSIGLIVAVLVDVFVVRLVLVPASMKLLGKYNWWLPKPLIILRDKLKLHDFY